MFSTHEGRSANHVGDDCGAAHFAKNWLVSEQGDRVTIFTFVQKVLRRLYVRKWLRTLRPKARQIALLKAEIDASKERYVTQLLAMLGALTLAWSKLEARLDHVNELAFLNGAKDVVDRQIPRALDRKLDFLGRSHRKLEWLVPLAAEAERIVTMVRKLRSDRHQLVHGTVDDLHAQDALKFIRHGDGPLALDVQDFSPVRLLEIAIDLTDCLELLGRHHASMNGALLQYRLDQLKT